MGHGPGGGIWLFLPAPGIQPGRLAAGRCSQQTRQLLPRALLRARRGVGVCGGLSFTWGGEEGEKATCECRKIFLFFLFFYLETTLVLTMLNTGCIVSLCCCRSVNSVSGKSP